jgi:hypothetical protein
MMEAVIAYKSSVNFYHNTWLSIPEVSDVYFVQDRKLANYTFSGKKEYKI